MTTARRHDALYRLGIGLLGGTCLYLGFLWWRWLVAHAGSRGDDPVTQLVLAAVVFVPMLLFIWLMARLIRR